MGLINDDPWAYEQGRYFAISIEREYYSRYTESQQKRCYAVVNVEYFFWDRIPRYFVMMKSDDGKYYKELVVEEVDGGNGYGLFPTKWEIAEHEAPACATRVWEEEEE